MNKYKKITVLITIFYFMNLNFIVQGESLIIPKKKPQISTENKIISELKSEILPLKKPKLKEKKIAEIKKEQIEKKNLGILIPKKKPLVIAQTKRLENKKKL